MTAGERHAGRSWIVTGRVYKAGKKIVQVAKEVYASSERDIEIAERDLRNELSEQAFKMLKKSSLKDVKIEVESAIK